MLGQRGRPVLDPPIDEVVNDDLELVGPKCVDPPFNNPNNLIPNACCHPRWFNELRRPADMPHCFADSQGLKHYGVSMKQIKTSFGVVDMKGRPIHSVAWAYGPNCSETFEQRLDKVKTKTTHIIDGRDSTTKQ